MPTEDKKDRREKESSPHTPYIEKGETEKKTQLNTRACACEAVDWRNMEVERRRRYVHGTPSLEAVLAHCRLFRPQTPEAIIRAWYNETAMAMWCDKEGNPIKNWAYHLMLYINYYSLHQAMRDPERIPDARKRGENNGAEPEISPERRAKIDFAAQLLAGREEI